MCCETSAMQKLAQLSQICAASVLLAGLENMHNIRVKDFHPKENFMNLKKHMIVLQRWLLHGFLSCECLEDTKEKENGIWIEHIIWNHMFLFHYWMDYVHKWYH